MARVFKKPYPTPALRHSLMSTTNGRMIRTPASWHWTPRQQKIGKIKGKRGGKVRVGWGRLLGLV